MEQSDVRAVAPWANVTVKASLKGMRAKWDPKGILKIPSVMNLSTV